LTPEPASKAVMPVVIKFFLDVFIAMFNKINIRIMDFFLT
jgi:hypothetical protein